MIVINRLCRSNSNKCLINYISTTVTSRCDKPKDEINETKKKDEVVNSKRRTVSKKIFELFENNVSEEKSKEAAEKLKSLKLNDSPVAKIVDAQKVERKKSTKRPIDEAAKKAKSRLEFDLVQSARKVSDELGGDVNKTDKDLISSLNRIFDNVKREPKGPYSEKIKSSAKSQDVITDSSKAKDTERLKGILSKIDKVHVSEEKSEESAQPINLFEIIDKSEGLNIFDPNTERNEGAKLKIWHELEKDELKYLTSSPPRNYYQELIKWTEEGKLWHFPINNEQGMDAEASVDFTEHVFLEDHLEPWCPKSGPLRHFMELVCVGLSKNPYLTVEDKRDHINWFKDYFEEKKRVLIELGAFSSRSNTEQPKDTAEKQITE